MSSSADFVTYVCDQLGGAGVVSSRKMFGEYGIYLDGKMVALICDDRFLVKKTQAGEALLASPVEVLPYEGAKPCFFIEELEDQELLAQLLRATWEELPFPKPKTK